MALGLNANNYSLKSPNLNSLNTAAGAAMGPFGAIGTSGAAEMLTKLKSLPGQLGVGLEVAGKIYDFDQEASKPKHLKTLEDQQFDLLRKKMLQEIQEQKEKNRWKRGFMRALGGR